MTNVVKFLNLGRVTYERSNNIQKLLSKRHNFNDAPVKVDHVLEQKRIVTNNALLVMEHDPVYTTGKAIDLIFVMSKNFFNMYLI